MNNPKHPFNHEPIISRALFRELTGISRTTEWRLGLEGNLPPLVRVEGRILGYPESAYKKWLETNTQTEEAAR